MIYPAVNDPSTGITPEADMDYAITVTIRGGRINSNCLFILSRAFVEGSL